VANSSAVHAEIAADLARMENSSDISTQNTPAQLQGLTLVHFSAQPEPFLVIEPTATALPTATEYLTKRAYIEPKSGRV